jgi:hypothetical protein
VSPEDKKNWQQVKNCNQVDDKIGPEDDLK